MFQGIFFEEGTYELNFWCSPRESNANTNTIDYSVGTLLTGSVSGPGAGGTLVGQWTEIIDVFTVSSDTTLRLTFQAAGIDETLGGFIDNVSITAVPLPAAAWLFGSALLGLVTVARCKVAV